MRKLLIILFLLILALPVQSATMVSGRPCPGGGEASCSYQSGQSCTVATDDTTGASANQYVGNGDYYPSANMNLCQIDIWIVTRPTADNVTMYVFEMSGTSLGTEVCHSETKAYSSLTSGTWNSFAITGDCNIVTGGTTKYGIVAKIDAAMDVGDKAVSGGCTTQGGMGIWGADKAIDSNYMSTYDVLFKLYGK